MDQAPPSSTRSRGRLVALAVGAVLGLAVVAAGLLVPRGPAGVDYVVVGGDTLGRIATEHRVTVDQLRAWNGLDGDLIQVGQVLRIQAAGVEPAAEAQPRRPRRAATAPVPGASRLMPSELPCLAPPDAGAIGEGDEPMFLASRGLSQAQVESAMGAALGELYACVPQGSQPDGVLSLSLQVACSGRVSSVQVLDDDALPRDLVACVTDSLRYAAFPAHDLPDGFGFHYPVTFRW